MRWKEVVMFSHYRNVKNPKVLGEIEIHDFLERIVNPKAEIKNTILRAREMYHMEGKEEYNFLKTTQLPCYTLNFCYDKYKKDENIKEPSGYIYIDLDDNTNVDLTNELICASWRSLSDTGLGILVKVDNLSLNNFKLTYKAISYALNIHSDNDAGKASQFNAQSYDPKLYYNENSIVWDTNTTNDGINKNTPITYSYKIGSEKDVNEMGAKFRYNNLDDFDFKGSPFRIFEEEKYQFAELYIPSKISDGSRNNTIGIIAHQSYALNPYQSIDEFRTFINKVNRSRCALPLDGDEIEAIIQKTINNQNIKPILNKGRRVMFNPDANLSNKVKYKIRGCVVGKIRSRNSFKKIENGICDWNLEKDGKISQLRLAKKLNMSKNTVNKYYHQFDKKIQSLKTAYKALKKGK